MKISGPPFPGRKFWILITGWSNNHSNLLLHDVNFFLGDEPHLKLVDSTEEGNLTVINDLGSSIFPNVPSIIRVNLTHTNNSFPIHRHKNFLSRMNPCCCKGVGLSVSHGVFLLILISLITNSINI